MNREQIEGICRQWAGRLEETWGELVGDALRTSSGKRTRLIGAAQQLSGAIKEKSARQLRDFVNHNRNWTS